MSSDDPIVQPVERAYEDAEQPVSQIGQNLADTASDVIETVGEAVANVLEENAAEKESSPPAPPVPPPPPPTEPERPASIPMEAETEDEKRERAAMQAKTLRQPGKDVS